MVLQIQQMLAQKSTPMMASQETLNASRKARRLYLGNLPTGMGLTDVQVTEFFNMACTESGIAIMPGLPVTDSWIAPEGKYGFVEFLSIDECTAGIALNGISLQGRQLVVKRPNDYEPAPDHIPTNIALVQNQANSTSVGMSFAGLQSGMAGMGVLGGLGAAPAPAVEQPPTTVLVLANMVTIDELRSEEEYQDILLDTKEECEKFGTVVTIKIPRPSEDGSAVPGVGKIFVLFDSSVSSMRAKEALHGRLFDTRTVEGTFLEESKFLTGELV